MAKIRREDDTVVEVFNYYSHQRFATYDEAFEEKWRIAPDEPPTLTVKTRADLERAQKAIEDREKHYYEIVCRQVTAWKIAQPWNSVRS